MGIILSGMIIVTAIAFGAGYFFLDIQQQKPAWQVYSTDSTRVGDPGHNLVGQNWSGDPVNADGGSETSS